MNPTISVHVVNLTNITVAFDPKIYTYQPATEIVDGKLVHKI